MTKRLIAIAVFLTLGFLTVVANAQDVIGNGALEQSGDSGPQAWKPHTWAGSGQMLWVDGGRGGGKCVHIESAKGGDLSWETFVPVEPKSTYRLSGWIKTKDLKPAADKPGRGALINIHGAGAVRTAALTGTNDWTRVEVLVRSGAQEKLHVNCLFGGWGLATGMACYDDVRLEKIDLDRLKPVAVIDTSKTGEPINPFIYGQFIEHLGRCIYGGIWAEMLEDRKFYFPITPEYDPYRESRGVKKDALLPVVGASPWQIIGKPGSVTMVQADSFVGEQTPLVQPGSGIRQNDLAIVKGKLYRGYVWLKAAKGSVPPTVAVTLSGAKGSARIDKVAAEYARFPLEFVATQSTDKASLQIAVAGGACLIGTASLMSADNVRGMRADTLAVLKRLNAPMYRWPGGNFVSGYDWRDGIGDRDRRPPRKNPAWTGVEHNDFGLDEYLVFCREVGAEPLITVNTGFGDAYSAAQEVEYCNGDADTVGGSWRVKNGHQKPYNVKWWCVGNEMYGRWQLGHMQLPHYVLKHNQVVQYMREADPSLKFIAVGSTGEWSQGMLKNCAEAMDLISEHFYISKGQDDIAAHIAQVTGAIKQKADAHRGYRKTIPELAGKDIRIAMDEWNYWYRDYQYGELGCIYRLRDALGIAAGLHEYFRNSDIITMAHYAQTVNVIGCIKTTKTAAGLAATGLPLMLYRQHFGTVPVEVTGDLSLLDIDLVAAWTADRTALTVGVVNPHRSAKTITLTLKGPKLAAQGTVWLISGDDPLAYNEPGKPPRVDIVENPVKVDGKLTVPPLSVSLYRVPVR